MDVGGKGGTKGLYVGGEEREGGDGEWEEGKGWWWRNKTRR